MVRVSASLVLALIIPGSKVGVAYLDRICSSTS